MDSDLHLDCPAIIPARGGSKGIPKKNLRLLAGKPLIAHTIEHARQSRIVNRVIVSTDDSDIAAVAQRYRAEIIWRPSEISGDEASSESALIHTLQFLEQTEAYRPDLVVFLQCTSPVREPQDIDSAIQTLLEKDADSLLSVTEFFHPFIWRVVDGKVQSFDYDHRRRPRRQDKPDQYIENGSIYVFKPSVLLRYNNRLGGKVALYEMIHWSFIDIDTLADFELCEWVFSRQNQAQASVREVAIHER